MSRNRSSVQARKVSLLLIAAAVPVLAGAQEVERKWETGLGFGRTFVSERQVQEVIEAHYALYELDEPFRWEILGSMLSGDKVRFDYRMAPTKLSKTDWEYAYGGNKFSSDEALLAKLVAEVPSDVGCPETRAIPGEWVGIPGGGAGSGADGSNEGESVEHEVEIHRRNISTGSCASNVWKRYAQRTRTVTCPNSPLMEWDAALGACGMSKLQEPAAKMFMHYSSTPLERSCDGQVGNPCDATTGNKSQAEYDLDLGWIQFVRHFNSMTSTPAGGFGPNWTHSHNLVLAMGVDTSGFPPSNLFKLGLIESNGTQIAFTKIGNDYEAANGSGDRAVQQGSNWLLYRSDEVLTFDGNGRLQQRAFENGTTLSYQHDAQGRLLSITHSSGRSLMFHYEAAAGEEDRKSVV